MNKIVNEALVVIASGFIVGFLTAPLHLDSFEFYFRVFAMWMILKVAYNFGNNSKKED